MSDLRKAAEMALETLEITWATEGNFFDNQDKIINSVKALRQALAQPEQEPVAWSITERNINSLQVDSINSLIGRAKHAHMIDVKVRVNGQDEWYEADWLKHLKQTAPPKREWQWLTGDEQDTIERMANDSIDAICLTQAKLKEKNT